MKSLSFDKMTKYYDETRDYDIASFNRAIDFITEKFPSSRYPNLFEPGIGTGRVAIPFAERGYKITGIDISNEMVNILKSKLADKKDLDITSKIADTTRIPFASKSFDISIIVHLFHLIEDWRKAADEICRVVNGPIIFLGTGRGKEIPFLNQKYKDICRELNHPIINVGANKFDEVLEYLKLKNYNVDNVKSDFDWTNKIEINQAFEYIRQRSYSFTHLVSEETHNEAIKILFEYLKNKYSDLSVEIEIANSISISICTSNI